MTRSTPGRDGRRRLRRLPRRPRAVEAAARRGRDRAGQPHRLLPVPARCCPRWPPGSWSRAGSRCRSPAALPGVRVVLGEVDEIDLDAAARRLDDPEGGRGEHRLRPAGAGRRQRQQAAADPRRRRARARLPRPARGAVPARPHHPPDGDGRRRPTTRPSGRRAARSSWSAPATPVRRWPRRACCSPTSCAPRTPSCATSRCAGCCSTPPTRVLPELDERLSRDRGPGAARAGRRGPDGRVGRGGRADGVRLTDGEDVATRSLVWCVGVRPDPLVESLGLETEKGRVVVDEYLRVPGHPEVFACGDAAAVPDLTRPGEVTAMTAQHAQRQGKLVGPQHRRVARPRHRAPVQAPRPGLRRRPRRPGRGGEPVARAAVRAAGEGRHPRLPPRGDAGQPGPGGGRLAAGRRAPAADRAARAGARRRVPLETATPEHPHRP